MSGDFEDAAYDQDLLAAGWTPMDHEPRNEEVEAHLERYLGECSLVLHEMLSFKVHLDVNVYPPQRGRDFTVYATSGMSDLPMRTGSAPELFGELYCAIPGAPEDHRGHPLVEAMRQLARYPHVADTWLGFQHTIGPPDGGETVAPDTRLAAYFLRGARAVVPEKEQERFNLLQTSAGEVVLFMALTAIHLDELDYKLSHGGEALDAKLDEFGVTEVYRPDRASVIAPKGPQGLLRRWFGRS